MRHRPASLRDSTKALSRPLGGMGFDQSAIDEIDGQEITPSSVGSSTNPVTVEGDTVSAEQLSGDVTNGQTISRLFGERVASLSPSGSVVDIDFTGQYDRYIIAINRGKPESDGELQCRVSTDGGSTFESGASAYHYAVQNINDTGASGSGGSDGTSLVELSRTVFGSGANQIMGATIEVVDPTDSSSFTILQATSWGLNGSGSFERSVGGGMFTTAAGVDAIRLGFSTNVGTAFASGEIDLYGVMK